MWQSLLMISHVTPEKQKKNRKQVSEHSTDNNNLTNHNGLAAARRP